MADPVVIIGGGLAGLTCAKTLLASGVEALLLEGSDAVGGRVRTDEVDGFLLDRGFQVLLTAYPEAQRHLNYESLALKPFEPGSLIQTNDGRRRLSDPWRQPGRALETAFSSVGSLADKLRIGKLRWDSARGSIDDVFRRPDRSTIDEITARGFSSDMIEQFLRPFLAGVFLDTELETSCRMLHYVFRMFSGGDTAIPGNGMGEISQQLAAHLPDESMRTATRVASIDGRTLQLEHGESITVAKIVVATEHPAAAALLPEIKCSRQPRHVHCVYFNAEQSPLSDRMLLLNGTGNGLVNNVCVPSDIAPAYAPTGRALISVSVVKPVDNTDTLSERIVNELQAWFGDEVNSWQHLRTYNIPYALPNQASPAFEPAIHPAKLRDGVYVCGDYRTNGSINGAMQSGRLTAEAIISES